MKDYRKYIGRTFKGFRFDDGLNLYFTEEMSDFIDKDLTIVDYEVCSNSFGVDEFSDGIIYGYPADLVIKQIEEAENDIDISKPLDFVDGYIISQSFTIRSINEPEVFYKTQFSIDTFDTTKYFYLDLDQTKQLRDYLTKIIEQNEK
jgi:hypothetical protein